MASSAFTRPLTTPQTCGKVERFHQTLKRFLTKQAPAESIAHLQLQLDAFRTIYNQHRPHRALDGRTPLQAFNARLKASPSPTQPRLDYRIRRDRLDSEGRVTLRYMTVVPREDSNPHPLFRRYSALSPVLLNTGPGGKWPCNLL